MSDNDMDKSASLTWKCLADPEYARMYTKYHEFFADHQIDNEAALDSLAEEMSKLSARLKDLGQ